MSTGMIGYAKLKKFVLTMGVILPLLGQAQWVVTGTVKDLKTEEPIPFANVFVKGTTLGVNTDYDGNFVLESPEKPDSVAASSIGYLTATLQPDFKGGKATLTLELERTDYSLQEIVILPGENPANVLMRKVMDRKKHYDKNMLSSYAYEVYNKVEVDLENLTDKFRQRKIFKPFQFMFSNMDSVSEEKPFLPFFLSESLSDFYYRKTPPDKREIIKATKVSGFKNTSISQFLGVMYGQFDIYNNWINIFDRQFVSPISNLGFGSYRYYLIDSGTIDGRHAYKVQFIPKRKGELLFEGDMWVIDTVYGVKQISMKKSDGADVNFIRSLSLYQEFELVADSVMMIRKDKVVANFIKPKEGPGLIARKTTQYKDFRVELPATYTDSLFKKQRSEISQLDSADERAEDFWQNGRHEKLSVNESKVYQMIDTLKKVPVFKAYTQLAQTVYGGYIDWGPVSFGNLFTFINNNAIEGWRIKYGMATSTNFSKNLYLNAYIAYGFGDKRMKYGGEFLWLLNKNPRESISASYRNDLSNTANFDRFYGNGGLLSSLGVRRAEAGGYIPQKLIWIREVKAAYHRETKVGYSFTVSFANRYFKPQFDFLFNGAGMYRKDFTTTEFSVTQRFAWQEKFLSGEFERSSLGSEYPIVFIKYTLGRRNLAGSLFNYHRFMAGVSDYQALGPLGKSWWSVEYGRTFGTLPYFLLHIPNGSETYLYNFNGFNTLKEFEVVTQQYIQVMWDHHFGGILFNRIPGIRKLKWRETFSFRMLWGNMSKENALANVYNAADNPMNQTVVKYFTPSRIPFMEASVGIENILKILRIDAFWRLTHLDGRGGPFSFRYGNFGLRAGVQLQF